MLFGIVPSAPTTVGIILVFTFRSLLSSRAIFWYLSTFSCSFYSCFSWHYDIYQGCRLVVLLYDYNIWSSVFNHVVRLYTYILWFWLSIRHYHWLSRTSVSLFRTRQAIPTTQTPVDNSGDFPYKRYLTKKWCPSKKHFAELDLQHGGKTAGIDIIWRNYVTVTLCIPIQLCQLAAFTC